MGTITCLPPKIFKYDITIDGVDGYVNEKCVVAFKKIHNGFTIEYWYDSFAEYGKYAVSIKVFQDFTSENIKDITPMEMYLCYIGIIDKIKDVSKAIYINHELHPEIKVETFDELESKIPFFT
jgi:hypothetical protein